MCANSNCFDKLSLLKTHLKEFKLAGLIEDAKHYNCYLTSHWQPNIITC